MFNLSKERYILFTAYSLSCPKVLLRQWMREAAIKTFMGSFIDK